MDFKLLGKRILSIALALVMAIPFIVLTPAATVDAAQVAPPAFTGFAPGRHRVTVNDFSARVDAWDADTRTMTVELSGDATIANGRFIVYARAGNSGLNNNRLLGGSINPEAGWRKTVDSGPITNISTDTSGTIDLVFPETGFTNTNVRLYIGVVSDRASAVGLINGTDVDVLTVNGITVTASHYRPNPAAFYSVLSYTLSGTPTQTGTYRVWFAADSAELGGTAPFDLGAGFAAASNLLVERPALLYNTANAPWSSSQQSPGAFSLTAGTAASADATGNWSLNVPSPGATVIRVEFAPPAPLIPVPVEPNNFFYVINYARETVSIGDRFNVWTQIGNLDNNGRPVVNADGEPIIIDRVGGPLTNVEQRHISVIFNRRADRIRADRGNWIMVGMRGEVDISRNVRRGGYLGVRWLNPVTRQHELIHVISIGERANHRLLRDYRANIYVPSRVVGDRLEINEFIHNPSDLNLEVNIGGDRSGLFNANRPHVATEYLAPGQEVHIPHDLIPRGTRGSFRIAPQESTNFLFASPDTNAPFMHVRDLARLDGNPTRGYRFDGDDWTPVPLTDVLAETGTFGSQLVRFRIPNQPVAPAGARMQLSPGRRAADPFFISRTNQHMKVLVGHDSDGPVWRALPQNNVTVPQIRSLFAGNPGATPAVPAFSLPLRRVYTAAVGDPGTDGHVPAGYHYVHDFEFRFFRANRVVSAPGFFTVRADAFDASVVATVHSGAVIGEGATVTAAGAELRTTGHMIEIRTRGGSTTVDEDDVVTAWFTNLPTGLVATVTRVRGNGSEVQVTISGTTTETDVARNLIIVIPAANIDGDADVPVVNPPAPAPATGGAALARVEIVAYDGGGNAPGYTANLVNIFTPSNFSMSLYDAIDNFMDLDWGWTLYTLTEVDLVTDPPGNYEGDVTWTFSPFNPYATDDQTVVATGTVVLPPTVSNLNDVPLTITVYILVYY